MLTQLSIHLGIVCHVFLHYNIPPIYCDVKGDRRCGPYVLFRPLDIYQITERNQVYSIGSTMINSSRIYLQLYYGARILLALRYGYTLRIGFPSLYEVPSPSLSLASRTILIKFNKPVCAPAYISKLKLNYSKQIIRGKKISIEIRVERCHTHLQVTIRPQLFRRSGPVALRKVLATLATYYYTAFALR